MTDVAILAQLNAVGPGYGRSGYELEGRRGAKLFDAIVSTTRARWRAVDGVSLTIAEARVGKAHWMVTQDGCQRFTLSFAGTQAVANPFGRAPFVLALTPPRWIDPLSGDVGLLETGIDPGLIAGLLRSPLVPPFAVT